MIKQRKPPPRIKHLGYNEPIPDVEPVRYRSQHGYIELRWKVGPDLYLREYEHRIVAGRPHPRFHVHHINGVKNDNRPENLQVVTPTEHARLHADVELTRLIDLYESGLGTKEIARMVAIDASSVFRRLKAAGVQMRKTGDYRTSGVDPDEAVEMYLSGVGRHRVAAALGIGVARLDRILDERGVPRRRPGRPSRYVGVHSARSGVEVRSGGICERCGKERASEWHHRKNRSQGGRWHVTNGLHLCSPCHRDVTENPRTSYAHGWSVRSTVDPVTVPVFRRSQWVWLTPLGEVVLADLSEIATWLEAA